MGYIRVPPSERIRNDHVCQVPHPANQVPGTVWECDHCCKRYIFAPERGKFLFTVLLIFAILPVGMLYFVIVFMQFIPVWISEGAYKGWIIACLLNIALWFWLLLSIPQAYFAIG